jgi:hypothetical protein
VCIQYKDISLFYIPLLPYNWRARARPYTLVEHEEEITHVQALDVWRHATPCGWGSSKWLEVIFVFVAAQQFRSGREKEDGAASTGAYRWCAWYMHAGIHRRLWYMYAYLGYFDLCHYKFHSHTDLSLVEWVQLYITLPMLEICHFLRPEAFKAHLQALYFSHFPFYPSLISWNRAFHRTD